MLTRVAIALTCLVVLGCSKSSSLSEAQVTAALQDCFSEVVSESGRKHKGWTVVSIGPIVQQGQSQLEASFKYSVDSEYLGKALFVRDQSGKYFLKEVAINHNDCSHRLPLQVK